MNLNKLYLGTKNQSDIYQYTLENDLHMKVQILTLGATIQCIELPFSDGTQKNVVLSYADWEKYFDNPLYLGATLAPNSGRIAHAILPIEEITYILSKNEGDHNTHGGFHNASLQNWDEVCSHTDTDCCSVTLSILLSDELDGFPGERQIYTCYTLTNDNILTVHYHATTDKSTYLNISNHTYFNLSGNFNRSGLEQKLEINALYYVENNNEHIPSCISKCTDSPFDFHAFTSIADNISLYPQNNQLVIANGYNNAFLINQNVDSINKALCLKDETSDYSMELYTDAPSIVLYSGGYIGDKWNLPNGFFSSASCAIALEAQDIPNTPNFLPTHCQYTSPDNPYDRTITFKFIKQ